MLFDESELDYLSSKCYSATVYDSLVAYSYACSALNLNSSLSVWFSMRSADLQQIASKMCLMR